MERLIATARAESRPAYILVASDYAVTPVTASGATPYPKPASGPDLAKAVAAIAERIQSARSVAILPAYTVSRFKLQDKLQALIETLGCPFAAMPMEKGILSETHPNSLAPIPGAGSSSRLLEAIEGADLVIDAGGVSFNEINTAAYSSQLAPEKLVTIEVDHVRIGNRIYNPVRMGDVFEMLARSVRKNFGYRRPRREPRKKPGGKPDDPITAANCIPGIETFSSRWIELSSKAAARVRGCFRSRFPRARRRKVQPSGARSAGLPGPHWESPWPTRRDGPCFSPAKARTS